MQGESSLGGGDFLVFTEAQIKANPTFTIDPIQGAAQIELRVSKRGYSLRSSYEWRIEHTVRPRA